MTCKGCNKERLPDEFYRHPLTLSGRMGKCKMCIIQQRRVHRVENIDKIHNYDRNRGALPHRREKVKTYARTESGRNSHRKANRLWIEKHADKRIAQNIANAAVRDGKIARQPCERCGANKAQKHHHDYSKALDVVWLCPPCHANEHKMLKEIERSQQ